MKDFEIQPKKICDMISDDSNIILPAIQRKFVWNEEQICSLFESIMEGYPIGTFLTWEISGAQINKKEFIGFYEFIKNYSEYVDVDAKTHVENLLAWLNSHCDVIIPAQACH